MDDPTSRGVIETCNGKTCGFAIVGGRIIGVDVAYSGLLVTHVQVVSVQASFGTRNGTSGPAKLLHDVPSPRSHACIALAPVT